MFVVHALLDVWQSNRFIAHVIFSLVHCIATGDTGFATPPPPCQATFSKAASIAAAALVSQVVQAKQVRQGFSGGPGGVSRDTAETYENIRDLAETRCGYKLPRCDVAIPLEPLRLSLEFAARQNPCRCPQTHLSVKLGLPPGRLRCGAHAELSS